LPRHGRLISSHGPNLVYLPMFREKSTGHMRHGNLCAERGHGEDS